MKIEYAERALRDIDDCLFWSARNFGRQAAYRYKTLLSVSIREIANDPALPGHRNLEGFEPLVRLYHIRHSRRRADVGGLIVKQPRHFIAYQAENDMLTILRDLHDSMDVERQTGGMKEKSSG